MKLFVARHGQTEMNASGHANGAVEDYLNEEGKRQAQDLAERLASEGIEAIYSTPLSRGIETAQPLADALGLEVITSSHLEEISFGTLSGLSQQEVAAILGGPTMIEALNKGDYDFTPYGGHNYLETEERVAAFINFARELGKTMLATTHGANLRKFHKLVKGTELQSPANAQEYAFEL